jgi:signal transduction histidine kinase
MSMLRRSSRLAPGSALLIGLLLLMLGLSSVLAYQALDAARSEARSAEQALRGYAGLAHWELSRRGDELLVERLAAAAAAGWNAADARTPPAEALVRVEAAVRREMRWCGCADAVQGVFGIGADGGMRTVSSRGMRAEARGAVAALAPSIGAGDSVRMREATIAGARHLLVYRVRRMADGSARAYGFALDPRRVAGPVLTEVLAGAPLLPATLRPGMTNRNAIAVVVTAAPGGEVYRSPAAIGRDAHWMDAKVGSIGPETVPAGAVMEALGGALGGMTARVSVPPGLAAGGVDGGTPESRLPLLLAVFGLTLALFGIAVVQLRRQQELVRLRDDFVSGVSHELRTPLAQIRLFADLLESGRLGDPAQRARSVRIINEESRRLTYLVENILHFSRAQRDASRLSPTPVEMGALVREVVDGFAPLAHHVEFATRVEPGVVARIDRDAVRQVLLNLLDNAAKYSPRGGVVQVGMAVVGFNLRIWVRDGGPGVPREDRARIWEPYRRLDREADGAVGGSGIGLAVVKDVVALHGGRVWVEDAPGGGARFIVEIPGATYAGPPGEEEPAPSIAPVAVEAR